jgi:hypothetical protein
MTLLFLFKLVAKIGWFLFDHVFLRHWLLCAILGAVALTVELIAKPRRFIKSQPPGNTKRVFEVTVNGWLGKKMTNAYWAGTTIPFPGFVLMLFWIGPVIPEVDPLVRTHEWVHVQQDVDAKWWIVAWYRYIKEWCIEAWKNTPNKLDFLKPWKYYEIYGNGYWNNKLEQQAYAIEYADRDNNTVPNWA